MKALILGAGYGKRLKESFDRLDDGEREKYCEAVEGRPKPLILVAGKPLIEYLLEKIEQETSIKEVYVVTNNHFYLRFEKWFTSFNSSLSVYLLNDGTESNEDRLGPIKDIYFAVEEGRIDDDLFILAGDTLFEMNFGDLLNYFSQKKKDIVPVYREDWSLLSRRGVVLRDGEKRLTDFLEKPDRKDLPLVYQEEENFLAAPIAYVLTRETVKRIPEFLGQGYRKEDNLIERLVKSGRYHIYTFDFKGRDDIGDIAGLDTANERYSGIFR